MPAKVVFLNGPPRCGKDTAGQGLYVVRRDRVILYKMTGPMDDHFRTVWRFPNKEWHRLRERDKEVLQSCFNGVSLRRALIDYSECYMKRFFGPDVFGKLCVQRLGNLADDALVVITDSGFEEEAVPILKHFGEDNCLKIEIHRAGCDFKNDSRSYWNLPGLKTVKVINNHPLVSGFMVEVGEVVRRWELNKEWESGE